MSRFSLRTTCYASRVTAEEIEAITIAHVLAIRSGLPPHRVAKLEAEIVALHETLVRNLSWFFRRRYVYQTTTIEDMYQAGRMGVILAVRSFDPNKSKIFGPHAYVRIRRQLQQHTLDDRIVRMEGTHDTRNYWAPPISYVAEAHAEEEHGDAREDMRDAARADEIRRYNLDKPSKLTVRKMRRRLRQKGLT